MRTYFRHRFANKRVFDESSILGEMSASLRRDITLFTCQDILNKVPLFQGAEPAFISAIAGVLRPALFSPGDVIIQQGDPGHRMCDGTRLGRRARRAAPHLTTSHRPSLQARGD